MTASGIVNGTTDYVKYTLSGSGANASGGTIQVPTVTHNTYDGADRLLTTCVDGVPTGSLCGGSPASNPQVTNTYDNDGNTTAAKDAGSGDTSGQSKNPWSQSSFAQIGGQDVSKTSTPPNGSSYKSTSTYNGNGDVSTSTNANGVTATNTHDGSGRVTQVSYSDSTPTVTYTYNPDGTVATMADGTGTTTYSYDGQGNLTSEATPEGTLSYTWDPAGNMTSMSYPDGNKATFTYNQLDQMASMNDGKSHTTSFSYDSAGNLSEIDYPNSTTAYYTYDSAERLDKIVTNKNGNLAFSFDSSASNGLAPDGNVQSMTTSQASGYGLTPGSGTGSNAGTDTFNYDPLGRTTADTQTGPTGTTQNTSETYNDNGEATKENTASGSQTITYPSTGSDPGTISSVSSTGNFPWKDTTYDADGNRTCQSNTNPCASDPTPVNFAYDGADRLNGVGFGQAAPACAGLSIVKSNECFTYDGNSEVVEADFTEGTTSNDQTMTWSTAGGGVPSLGVWTSDINGSTQHTDFIGGPDGLPIEQLNVNGTTTADWYYQDPMNNTRALLDSSANVDQTYNYDDYGNETPGIANVGSPDTPLRYQGDFTDTVGTGFTFMQARWYDPQSAQFISRDPMVDQTLQPYAYAADNPTNSSDPTGLCNSKRDRYKVKEGYDSWAHRHPKLHATPKSVGGLIAMGHQRPPSQLREGASPRAKNTRYGKIERTEWKISGLIFCANSQHDCVNWAPGEQEHPFGHGHGSDGDIGFELGSGSQSLHCEIPNEKCTMDSPWHQKMIQARRHLISLLSSDGCPDARRVFGGAPRCHLNLPIFATVSGLGFCDTVAHKKDYLGRVQPELHPVLGLRGFI